jgi:hypothetical protein
MASPFTTVKGDEFTRLTPAGIIRCLQVQDHSGASPCTRFSRAPRWGATPTSTPADPPPRIRRVLAPTWRFSLTGCFPFRDVFRLGLWRIRLGSPPAYSPLSFASRARVPVSPTMDSPTWFRGWFAAHLNRALRLPAWEEVQPGELLSIVQHAHVYYPHQIRQHEKLEKHLTSAYVLFILLLLW